VKSSAAPSVVSSNLCANKPWKVNSQNKILLNTILQADSARYKPYGTESLTSHSKEHYCSFPSAKKFWLCLQILQIPLAQHTTWEIIHYHLFQAFTLSMIRFYYSYIAQITYFVHKSTISLLINYTNLVFMFTFGRPSQPTSLQYMIMHVMSIYYLCTKSLIYIFNLHCNKLWQIINSLL